MASITNVDKVMTGTLDTKGKVILEYIYVNNSGYEIMSKTRVVDFEPKTPEDCPLSDTYMWTDKEGWEFRDIILKPVAIFENPFLEGPHKIVLCELWINMDTPAPINTRYSCRKTMERLECDPQTGHIPNQPHDPWFGIEQEYFILGGDGVPLSYYHSGHRYSSLMLFSKIGHKHSKNIGKERSLAERHLIACLYAGVNMYGGIRENGPSQWEYEIGPCLGVSIGDHLTVSRYILLRLAEMIDVQITFQPNPGTEEEFLSGCHINFSTSKMRGANGIKFIKHAIDILSNSDQAPLLSMYDPTLEEENKTRLEDMTNPWHPSLEEFKVAVGDKKLTTIRIPTLVDVQGCGYFEDRRPSSNIDPYAASEGIVRASIFGDYLLPEHESLKDLTIWDQEDL